MERDITAMIKMQIGDPWSVSWFIDMGWYLTFEDYLVFNKFFPERVRGVGLNIQDIWCCVDQAFLVDPRLLSNPHVTTLWLSGTPPDLNDGFPGMGAIFENLRQVHLPFFRNHGDEEEEVDHESDDPRSWAHILPKNILLILPNPGPDNAPWADFREVELLSADMWNRRNCQNMMNVKELVVTIEDASDICALLPGMPSVKALTIYLRSREPLHVEAVKAIASKIPDYWKCLECIHFRGNSGVANRSLYDAFAAALKAAPLRITRSSSLYQ